MNIEAALDTALKGSTPVTNVYSTRIHWMKAEDLTVLPYLVYRNIIDTDGVHSFSATDTGKARIQFDSVGDKKAAARTGILAVRTLLRGKNGTIGGMTVYSIMPAGMREVYNEDTKRYVFTAEYEIEYSYT